MKSRFLSISQDNYPDSQEQAQPSHAKRTLEKLLHASWVDQLVQMKKVDSEAVVPEQVTTITSLVSRRRTYTAASSHKVNGNSNVEFFQGTKKVYGEIMMIFCCGSAGTDRWFIIAPYDSLKGRQVQNNPWREYEEKCHCYMVLASKGKDVVVHENEIIGHVAIMDNKEGQFGISQPTKTVVSLGILVSFIILSVSRPGSRN